LSDTFWAKCTVLVPLILAFFGAAWMIRKHKDEIQKKFKDEIKEINSRVYFSEIVPYVIRIVEEVEHARENPNDTYEDILAKEKFVSYIENIADSENKVSDVRYSYKNLQEVLSEFSINFLLGGILVSLISGYHLYNIGLYIPNYDSLVFVILIIILLVILIQMVGNFKTYINIKEHLSNKYDEIVIGV